MLKILYERNFPFCIKMFLYVISNTDCGSNITGQTNGVMTSPNYPEQYATSGGDSFSQQCHWFIHVRPGHQVMLYFEVFEVEGRPEGTYIVLLSSLDSHPFVQGLFSLSLVCYYLLMYRLTCIKPNIRLL